MTTADGGATGATPVLCPSCGAHLPVGSRFCEGCGTPVGSVAAAAGATGDDGAAGVPRDPTTGPTDADPAAELAADPAAARVAAGSAVPGGGPLDDAPISAPTRRPAAALADPPPAMTRRPCAECGGEVGPDRYCTSCGTRAPSEREHFREHPAGWVAGVCDRGVTHARNEDAMALLAAPEPGTRAVLVVLDGVSNSIDSDVASLAGAHAAREVLRLPLPAGMGTPASRGAAVGRVLGDAVAAANTAIVAVTDPDSPNPASATIALAVLEGSGADVPGAVRVHVANIGDSRAYWLPDDAAGVQLTVDDSMAQAQIAAGVPREVAESSPQAHAITRWLGRDAPDLEPTVATLDVDRPGWLLVCSDGLWNYASTPEELRAQVDAAVGDGAGDPAALALALVGFANGRGGQDNITVALARVGPALPPSGEGASDVGQNAEQAAAASADPSDTTDPTDPTRRTEGGRTDG